MKLSQRLNSLRRIMAAANPHGLKPKYVGAVTFAFALATQHGCSSDDKDKLNTEAPTQISLDNTGTIQDIKAKLKEFNVRFEKLNKTLGQQTASVKLNNIPSKWEGIGKLSLTAPINKDFSLFAELPSVSEQEAACDKAKAKSLLTPKISEVATQIVEWIEKLDTPQPSYHAKMAAIEIHKGEELKPFSLKQLKTADNTTVSRLIEAATTGEIVQLANASFALDERTGATRLEKTFVEIDLENNVFSLKLATASTKNTETASITSQSSTVAGTWEMLPEERASQYLRSEQSTIDANCKQELANCKKASIKETRLSGRVNPGNLEVVYKDLSAQKSAEFGLAYNSEEDGSFTCKIDYANASTNL